MNDNRRLLVMKRVAVMAIATVCVLLGGCVESEDEYVLNPDGSGKVVRKALFRSKTDVTAGINMGDGDGATKKKTPEEELKEACKEEVQQSDGVDVWKDITVFRAKDGRIGFNGTAYFKDISELRLHNGGFSLGERPVWTKNGQGRYVLEFKKVEEDGEGATKPVKPAPKLAMSVEEVKEGVANARNEYKDMMDMMGKALSCLKMHMSFRLPGTVQTSRNFKTDKTGTLSVLFDGVKMRQVMDRQVKDDKWMEQQVRAGVSFGLGEGPDVDEIMNEKMFGQKGSISATGVATDSKPLFDYTAEVAAAKLAYPALLNKLGVAGKGGVTKKEPAPTIGESLKDVKVEEISLVQDDHHKPTVRVTAVLPSAGMEANEGRVERALADNGENLLPEDAFWREIAFPRLADDKTTVTFDVQIRKPSAGVKSIKELSGCLVYSIFSGTRTVDLGISELVPGAVGTEHLANITKVEAYGFDGVAQDIKLDVAISYDAIKSVQVLDAAGRVLDAEKAGGGGFFGKSSITIRVKGAVPKKGRIKLELCDNIRKISSPFVLRDVALPKP